MDIFKLKTFLILSECKSFSKTSDILYCSQPAVSKQIKSLEDELNVPLFDRMRNETSLTIEGIHFKEYAEEIVKLYENSVEHIRQIEDINKGTLFFGATNFIGVYIVPKIIKKFQILYPNIKISMLIKPSKELFRRLEKHEIEFVFLSHYIEMNKDAYIIKNYCKDRLVLIVNTYHRLSNRKSCILEELKDELFVMKDENSSLYKFLDEKFENFNFEKKLTISNQEGIKQAVIEGVGISIMSKASVEAEIKAGFIKVLEIEDYDLERNINLVHDKKKHITPAGKAFIKLLEIDSE